MVDWIRRLDNHLFAPPWELKTVLALVAPLLGINADGETQDSTGVAMEQKPSAKGEQSQPR